MSFYSREYFSYLLSHPDEICTKRPANNAVDRSHSREALRLLRAYMELYLHTYRETV
jgi:hypothetical protein